MGKPEARTLNRWPDDFRRWPALAPSTLLANSTNLARIGRALGLELFRYYWIACSLLAFTAWLFAYQMCQSMRSQKVAYLTLFISFSSSVRRCATLRPDGRTLFKNCGEISTAFGSQVPFSTGRPSSLMICPVLGSAEIFSYE